MANFFQDNKISLGAALVGGLIAAAATQGGSLIIPLMAAAVAFLAPGLLGKDENGVVAGFRQKAVAAAEEAKAKAAGQEPAVGQQTDSPTEKLMAEEPQKGPHDASLDDVQPPSGLPSEGTQQQR